jgi:hypothetical protein
MDFGFFGNGRNNAATIGEPVAKSKEKLKQEKDNSVFLPKATDRVNKFSGSAIDIMLPLQCVFVLFS